MLTKQDLRNIGDLIDTKLEEKLESKLEEKLESKLTPIYNELKTIKSDVSTLKSDVKNLQKDMTTVKKDVKKIKNVTETDFGYHEKQNRYTIRNVQQIQRHLGMTVMTIDAPLNNF